MTAETILLSAPPQRMSIAHHNGPGLRGILWVQGCTLRCTRECLNPHLLSTTGGVRVPVREAISALEDAAANYSELEGFTVLGGEPFDQAQALAAVLEPLHTRGYSVMVYSGHTHGELRSGNDAGWNRLLAVADILVDGPFVRELYEEGLVWRGSSNQRIVRLTERYSEQDIAEAIAVQRRALYVSMNRARGEYVAAGAQSRAVARQLRTSAALRSGGDHGQ